MSISAFVDPDDYERLVERARAQERSTSAELRVAIREHLRGQVAQRRVLAASRSTLDCQAGSRYWR